MRFSTSLLPPFFFFGFTLFSDGTLRWQAPEILSAESVMTPEADVYSFAIVCVEILTNGELPWPMLDDQAVQQLVLRWYHWGKMFTNSGLM